MCFRPVISHLTLTCHGQEPRIVQFPGTVTNYIAGTKDFGAPISTCCRDIVTKEFPKGKRTYQAGDEFAPNSSESTSLIGMG